MLGVKLPLLVLPVLLNACATNGFVVPKLTERELMIERKLNLPPEPNPAVNNATILGVDANKNNIRDDVERKIAFLAYPDMKVIQLHNARVSLWRSEMKALDNVNVTEMLKLDESSTKISICLREHLDKEKHSYFISEIDSLLVNTEKRFKAINKYHSHFSGMFFSLPSKEESLKYCAKFDK